MAVLIDTFEQSVQRPSDRREADTYYSGKKKQHTHKTQVAVDEATGHDDQWTNIRAFLRSDPNVYVGTGDEECRRFVEAVLWIDRSGAQWRLLPSEYGNWNSVYKRFARWCDQDVWERMLAHVADDPDMEHGIVDSTIVRAHPCAAGTEKRHGG